MEHFILFGTQACHLCEEAESLLRSAHSSCVVNMDYEIIDIAEQEEWQQQYGVRIPVLFHPKSGAELGWPFDETALQNFINELIHQ